VRCSGSGGCEQVRAGAPSARTGHAQDGRVRALPALQVRDHVLAPQRAHLTRAFLGLLVFIGLQASKAPSKLYRLVGSTIFAAAGTLMPGTGCWPRAHAPQCYVQLTCWSGAASKSGACKRR